MTEPLPPPQDRQPPVGLPRERLQLPGPRAIWWILAGLGMLLPVVAHVAGDLEAETAQTDSLTSELRGRTFIWRLMTNTQPPAATGKPAAACGRSP